MDQIYPISYPSSSIPHSLPPPHSTDRPLPRNNACLPCRRKKLRCTGERPHCRTCINTYEYKKGRKSKKGEVVVLRCEYMDLEGEEGVGEAGSENGVGTAKRVIGDEVGEKGSKKRKVGGGQSEMTIAGSPSRSKNEANELQALKERMAHLEDLLKSATSTSQNTVTNSSYTAQLSGSRRPPSPLPATHSHDPPPFFNHHSPPPPPPLILPTTRPFSDDYHYRRDQEYRSRSQSQAQYGQSSRSPLGQGVKDGGGSQPNHGIQPTMHEYDLPSPDKSNSIRHQIDPGLVNSNLNNNNVYQPSLTLPPPTNTYGQMFPTSNHRSSSGASSSSQSQSQLLGHSVPSFPDARTPEENLEFYRARYGARDAVKKVNGRDRIGKGDERHLQEGQGGISHGEMGERADPTNREGGDWNERTNYGEMGRSTRGMEQSTGNMVGTESTTAGLISSSGSGSIALDYSGSLPSSYHRLAGGSGDSNHTTPPNISSPANTSAQDSWVRTFDGYSANAYPVGSNHSNSGGNAMTSSSTGPTTWKQVSQPPQAQAMYLHDEDMTRSSRPSSQPAFAYHDGNMAQPLPSSSAAPPPIVDFVPDLGNGDISQQILMEVFWPGWPSDLCDPHLMGHLIDTFFDRAPTITRATHRGRLLEQMKNPPTHKDFPKTVMLHAICAVASLYSARVFVDPNFKADDDEPDDPRTILDFGERHALLAKRLLVKNPPEVKGIYINAQATQILLGFYHFKARWLEAWTLSGMLGRQCGPLGLNLYSQNKATDPLKRNLINSTEAGNVDAAHADIEREEARALMWLAVLIDVAASAGSLWMSAINLDEIDVPLPASQDDFEKGGRIPENPQNLLCPDFYTKYPVVDSFVLHIKSTILFGRVNAFVRRSKLNGAAPSGRGNLEFQKLESLRLSFIANFPRSQRDPLTTRKGTSQKAIDVELFAAHVRLHHIGMALHEPLADVSDPTNPSTGIILNSARGILNLIYLVISSNFDLCYLIHSHISFLSAARVLNLFMDYALRIGGGRSMAGAAEDTLVEIQVIQMVFQSQGMRFPLGQRHSRMIAQMLGEHTPDLNPSGDYPRRPAAAEGPVQPFMDDTFRVPDGQESVWGPQM